jgi:hypothetical protein
MATVPLYGKHSAGRSVRVDEADLPLVEPYRWLVQVNTKPRPSGPYAITWVRNADGTRSHVYMHDLIMGTAGVDHRDRDGLNNCRCNLRVASQSQNGANTLPRVGTSRYKGVSWDRKMGCWRAQITVRRKMRYLGLFGSEEDAARAYDEAALETWGEYARLNLPGG